MKERQPIVNQPDRRSSRYFLVHQGLLAVYQIIRLRVPCDDDVRRNHIIASEKHPNFPALFGDLRQFLQMLILFASKDRLFLPDEIPFPRP